MNLKRKVWMMLAVLLLITAMTPTALAASEDASNDDPEESSSFWEDAKGAGSEVWQSAKEHAPGWWQSVKGAFSSAKDVVQEHGPGLVEAAQEKGSELLDKGAGALQSAGEQIPGFLEDQQNQFWERTEQQIYGGSGSHSTTSSAPESSAPASSALDEVAGTPASSALDETDPAPEATTADSPAPPDSASSAPDESSTPPAQDAKPEYTPGHRIVADEDTTNAEGAEEAETTEDGTEPQTAWERFWDLSKRDAALRWQITVEFWPVMLLAVLIGFLLASLKHRKR